MKKLYIEILIQIIYFLMMVLLKLKISFVVNHLQVKNYLIQVYIYIIIRKLYI